MLVPFRHPVGIAVSALAAGWLVVDRPARRVSATCGGDPAPGCVNGRWRILDHGLVRRYLLGR
ncbi:MAG TPA: hypothetical protein VF072_08555 [Thermoleophilaceae bacterium]